jgi:hypothetical protein
MLQAQAKAVKRFAVRRVGVAPGQAFDGFAEMSISLGEFAAAKMPKTDRVVAAGVAGIAAQRLAPVGSWTTRRMAILFQVQAGDKKLVGAGNFGRHGRFGGGRRDLAFRSRPGLV